MGKSNKSNNDGWSKKEESWINSLSIEEFADLLWMADNGPDNKKDKETLERLRKSYQAEMNKGEDE